MLPTTLKCTGQPPHKEWPQMPTVLTLGNPALGSLNVLKALACLSARVQVSSANRMDEQREEPSRQEEALGCSVSEILCVTLDSHFPPLGLSLRARG